jgi:thioredoxin-dependent peroxiredoxin
MVKDLQLLFLSRVILTSFVQMAFKARMSGVPMHMMADGNSINTIPAEFLIDIGLMVKRVPFSQGLNDCISMDVIRNFAKHLEIIKWDFSFTIP